MPQLGAAIGGLIGGAIDPEVITGPHIGDGPGQSSNEGVPIPWILGVGLTQGNIVQKSARREVKKEDDGKGGPVQVTYEAHQDFAIMICESSETRNSTMLGVQVVKCNGKIVYDTRPEKNFSAENAKFLRQVTFYNGAEDQMPDPTLESITGVGNTPAYRGVYLAVFRDINLTQYGDAIPTYEFVMVSNGSTIVAPGEYGAITFGTQIFPWKDNASDSRDPRRFGVRYEYAALDYGQTADSPGINWSPNLDSALEEASTYRPIYSAVQLRGWSSAELNVTGSAAAGVSAFSNFYPWSGNTFDANDQFTLGLVFSRYEASSQQLAYYWDSSSASPPSWYASSFDTLGGSNFGSGVITFGGPGGDGTAYQGDDPAQKYSDIIIACRPLLECPTHIEPWWIPIPDAPGYYLDENDEIVGPAECVERSGVFRQLAQVVRDFGSNQQLYSFPQGPLMEPGDPDDTQVFWESAYANAVGAGTMPPGLTYGVDYPVDTVLACECTPPGDTIENDAISVAEAISRICDRGGVPWFQIDVTEVDYWLLGYQIASDYNGADCVRPLLSAYSLYGSEYDLKIHFRKRGAPVDVVIDPNDLIEGTAETDQTIRGQSKEYPRKILLSYVDITQDFTVRPQMRQALTPDVRAIGEQSLQVSVVMEPNQAAQLADVFYKRSRAAVEGSRKFSIPYGTATDCYLQIVAGEPVGFDNKRYIVDKITLEDGQLNLELAYDRQSAWVSNVTGIPALPPTPPPSSLNGPTLFAVMNQPVLIDSNDVLGVNIAACGILDSWRGCQVLMSRDNEATWTVVIPSLTEASVVGSLLDPLPLAPYDGTDVTNTLHVKVYGGELSSITELQLLNEANPCAIVKDDGTTEILQFRDADMLAEKEYNLTVLPRGRLNTTPEAHPEGARFCMLTSVYFVELTIADIGRTLYFKPVSFGSSPDDNPSYALLFDPAISQTEWPPGAILGERVGNDLVATVIPRHRLGTDINPVPSVNFTGYRWTFSVGPDSYTVDTTAATYTLTEAQQIATFGSAQPAIDVAVSQLNRITGAGPALEDTL